jgi:hypothetical protein
VSSTTEQQEQHQFKIGDEVELTTEQHADFMSPYGPQVPLTSAFYVGTKCEVYDITSDKDRPYSVKCPDGSEFSVGLTESDTTVEVRDYVYFQVRASDIRLVSKQESDDAVSVSAPIPDLEQVSGSQTGGAMER